MLREMATDGLPVVGAVGVVTGRRKASGPELDAVLITRYLDYSLPYQYLFGLSDGPELWGKLIDAGVLLLVRLHLEGVFWGDFSLANTLFRRDAGALMAYLVDAETAQRHDAPLGPGLRGHDVDDRGGEHRRRAHGPPGGPPHPDRGRPLAAIALLEQRYHELWTEITAPTRSGTDERHRIEERIRRLNELGFDVEELVLEETDEGGHRLRIQPVLVEEGHHARELARRTGLRVQENQARRLLNDITAYRSWLERTSGRPVPEAVGGGAVAGARSTSRSSAQIPPDLTGRREPPEAFHELLEHRWFLSEREGREVSNEEALADYVTNELPSRPAERTVLRGRRRTVGPWRTPRRVIASGYGQGSSVSR